MPYHNIKWRNESKTPTYYVWRNMRSRCHNPRDTGYVNYGKRGIAVCERWRDDYDAFVEDMGFQPPGLTLERRDNSLGYSRENCYWAEMKAQANNKRSNKLITAFGKTQTLQQWADELQIGRGALAARLKTKTPEEALTRKDLRSVPRPVSPINHGTAGYQRGCRCETCVEETKAYRRKWKKGE